MMDYVLKIFFKVLMLLRKLKFLEKKIFHNRMEKFNRIFFDSNKKKEMFIRSVPRLILEIILIIGICIF